MTEKVAESPAPVLRAARLLGAAIVCVTLIFGVFVGRSAAQVPGPNINMVSGTTLPDGDPFLQRQNEPSIAVSTRNPCHLLAGANDYRTVDIPGLPDDKENGGDAWLGLFKSFDCGRTWKSNLIPGYPQDQTPEGKSSPLFGLAAGADPIVRAGTNGLFYYSGIAFNRGANAPSKVFVARFIDNNVGINQQGQPVDPIAYLGTSVVDAGTPGQFNDKPFIAVDVPRNGKTCSIDGQTIPSGTIYVVFATFVGKLTNNTTKLMVAQSTDCGVTWTKPVKISEGVHTNQGAMIAVAPNGIVYVAWRQFVHGNQPDAIVVSRSTDFGKTFSKATTVATIAPFDQSTSGMSFRINAYPTIAIDGTDRVYLAWSARGFAQPRSDPTTGDARIVMSTSTDGVTWSAPVAVDNLQECGHQIMPALTFAGGKLQLLYYDLRDDHTYLVYHSPDGQSYGYPGTRVPAGDRVNNPEKVFWQQIKDTAPDGGLLLRRHTIDVRGAQAPPGPTPTFTSWPISQYAFGVTDWDIEQIQFNPPNLPLYAHGTTPFFGDYIDVAGLSFVPTPSGGWAFNTDATGPQVFHAVWTDNRDVRPPITGLTWESYTPPTSSFTTVQCVAGATGMRNANVYTSRITPALALTSPGNAKALGTDYPRTFPVVVHNDMDDVRRYRLTIFDQPPDGKASFVESAFAAANPELPVTQLDVWIAPMSTVARTVFVTSSVPAWQPRVDVIEIDASGTPVPSGNQGSLVLNSDLTNPAITNPAITNETFNPAITNPAITNPAITNPAITNPAITNPAITNPAITNPAITNPAITNPAITNPAITNPAITNPAITNPAITNPAITNPALISGTFADVTWTVKNTGTSAGSFSVKLFARQPLPQGFIKQLVVHKSYTTPIPMNDCSIGSWNQDSVLASILDPVFTDLVGIPSSSLADPAITNGALSNATLALAPGEEVKVTLRIFDPDKSNNLDLTIGGRSVNIDPALVSLDQGGNYVFDVLPIVTSQAVNSSDFTAGVTLPPAAIPSADIAPLQITTTSFPDEVLFDAAGGSVAASGGWGTYSWTITSGSLPPGMSLDAVSGAFAGTPTALGTYTFTVQVTDCANNSCAPGVTPQTASRTLSLRASAADQNFFFPTTVPMSFGSGTRVAQVFFAGTDAPLTAVRFTTPLTCPAGTVITAEVRQVTGGAPPSVVDSGPPLATASFTMPASPLQPPPFSFASPVPFVLNAPFAIVLSAANSCTLNGYGLDAYAGRALIDTGGGWGAHPSSVPDLPLQTLVMPQEIGYLSANRLDHVSGELPGSRVLLAGGWRPGEPFAEIYDLGTDQSMPVAGSYANRAQATLTRLADGRLVIIGGRATDPVTGNPVDLTNIDIFNPATNTLASGGALQQGRSQHTATLLPDGRIFVAGGLQRNSGTDTALQSAEIYDPATGSCQLLSASMNVARFGHSAVLLADGGHVLLAGGLWAGPTAEVYDISAKSFTSTGPMVAWRSGPTATLLTAGPNAGKVLIAGGLGGDSRAVSLAELFDPAGGGTFSTHAAMRVARGNHTATMLDDGSIVFAGGTPNWEGVNSHAVASIETYDPVAGQFTSQGTMKANRERHTATRIGSGPSTVIVFAGGNSSSALTARTIEVYNPASGALAITVAGLPEGVIGQPYPGATLTASGGTGTGYTFTVVTGELPTGLTLSPSGDISGQPATGTQGPWTFTVRVQDSASNTAYRTLIIAIDPLQITGPPTLPSGIVGAVYPTTELQATGYGTLTWSIKSGSLPPGLSLSGAGVISGTPTSVGTFAFTAQVVDAIEQVASRTFIVTVSAMPGPAVSSLAFTQQPPPATAGGQSFDVAVQALDAGSNPVVGASVNLNLSQNPGGNPPLALTASTDLSGTAHFPSVVIDRGGYDYSLVASAGAVSSPASSPFDVIGFVYSGLSAFSSRVSSTAVRLADGRVLIAGGDSNGDKAEIYDPALGTFTAITNTMTMARRRATATLLPDGKVLIAGGWSGTGWTNTAEIYDPALGTFTATAGTMNYTHGGFTATLLPDGTVLVVGGNDAYGDVYHPSTWTFTATSAMNVPRMEHTATLLGDGTVLLAGGAIDSSASAEIYDPVAVTFTSTGAMQAARWRHTATLLPNGKVLIAGGETTTDGPTYTSAEVYDPSTRAFASTGTMTSSHSRHMAAALPGGPVLVAGGFTARSGGTVASPTTAAELYDVTSGTFTATGSLLEPWLEQAVLLGTGRVLTCVNSVRGQLYYPADPPYQTAGFESGGTLLAPRREHTATQLADGRILVAGGRNAASAILNTAEVYDPISGTSVAVTGTMSQARTEHTATLLPNGKVLLVGGRYSDGPMYPYSASADLYDPVSNSLSATGSMATSRPMANTATLLPNGKVLIVGGVSRTTAEVYDPATGTFSTAGTYAGDRVGHTATLLPNGKVMIVGGEFYAAGELFDPATTTFTPIPIANGPHNGYAYHTATLLGNGTVLIAGGVGTTPDAEIYDPATNGFVVTGNMTQRRTGHVAARLFDGRVAILGGSTPSPWSPVDTAEVFNPGTGTFAALGSMGTARAAAAGMTLVFNGKVIVIGGWDAISTFASIALYRPR